MGKKKFKQQTPLPDTHLPSGFSTSTNTEMDNVTASLTAIYGETPAKARKELSILEHGRRNAWLMLGLGIAGFITMLTVAAWLGFWWWSGTRTGDAGLQVAIEGPSRVSIGQETTYFINWYNRSKDPLASAELRISFPPDFAVSSIEPKPTEQTGSGGQAFTYRLGAQAVEARGIVKITGTFTGALGTKSAIQVIGTYRPAAFNSDFERLETRELEYTDSVLTGSLELPPKVLPGDRVTLSYHLQNNGKDSISGLEARVRMPDGFVRDASGTADLLDERIVRMPVGALEAGASTTISIRGSFALGVHGDVAIHAEAGRVNGEGVFAAAQRADGQLSVLAGDLNISVVVNGSDKDRSVSQGERQRIAVAYENTSGEELRNVVLRIHVGADIAIALKAKATGTIDLVNWKELDDEYAGRRDHDTLSYSSEEIGQLERLPPDASGLIELSVPIMGNVTSGRDVPILVYAEATIGFVDKVKVNRTVKTQPITMKLQTDAMPEALARYASEEGAPVGRGPLPPVVGTSTVYRIEWRITKTLHALDRVSVTANLPKSVSWESVKEVGAGEVSYDPELRLVTWKINKMPEDVNELGLSFDVSLIPSEADAGRFASLLGESRFEFSDAAIGEPLLRTAPALSTDLSDDPLAKNKGVVKKP